MTLSSPAFLRTGSIGRLELKNRLVRAPTSETMANASGESTDALIRLYADLARGGAGLIITGHIYVEPCGQYEPMQLGLDRDDRIAPLRKMTDAVHREGGVVFAELSHAGSQSTIPEIQPIAPSSIPNAMFGRPPLEMTDFDVRRVIAAFGSAAARAKQAGFDGIHIHSGNGYLLSQFNSPYTNRRIDQWGGDVRARSSFIRAVYRAIRDAIGTDLPITLRLGLADAIEGGLTLEEGLTIAKLLEAEGLDGLELSYGLMSSYTQNIRPYVGVSMFRGLMDGMVPILFNRFVPEAYYRPFAKAAKAKLSLPLILVGGLRSTEVMDDIIRSGDADFVALARPFVREPDIANQIVAGRRGPVSCVSCNLCFKHEGIDALRCWRTPTGLFEHLIKFYVKPMFSQGPG
jgi:2,4-dienoyl-CoA reductase-like NADH-dependent reductase (Old Yellow Enzyme family)